MPFVNGYRILLLQSGTLNDVHKGPERNDRL